MTRNARYTVLEVAMAFILGAGAAGLCYLGMIAYLQLTEPSPEAEQAYCGDAFDLEPSQMDAWGCPRR